MEVVKEFIFLLIVIVAALQKETNSAAILGENVELNEIANFIIPEEKLLKNNPPPLSEKNNFYNFNKSRKLKEVVPYVVEINKGYIKFQTLGFDAETVILTPMETESIQRLSLAIVDLLNKSQLSSPTTNETEKLDPKTLNPVITITNSGIFLRFANVTEDAPKGDKISQDKRYIIWKFISGFAKNIFEERLKNLNLTDMNATEFDFPIEFSTNDLKQFENFIATIWKIMKLSVKYAEANFKEWTTSLPKVETDSNVKDAITFEYEMST